MKKIEVISFKIMKVLVAGLLTFTVVGCTTDNEKDTSIILEYGDQYKLEEIMNIKEDETITSSLEIDTKIVGTYDLKLTIQSKDKSKKEINKKIIVKDSNAPKIELVQNKDKVYQVTLKGEYNPVGNIEKISDKVDGEMKDILLVDSTEYEKQCKEFNKAKGALEKNVYKNIEDINKYASERLKSTLTLVNSEVDTSKPGTYEVKIASVDTNYNITEEVFKVKVLGEGKEVDKKKLASGAAGSKMGNAINYNIKKFGEENQESKNEKDASTEAPISSVGDSIDVSNYQSSNNVSDQGSPVLRAALNRLGQNLWCDDLVTLALQDSGWFYGNNSLGTIGVYYFPSLGTFISADQAVPGDLVYYDNGGTGTPHIAVYAGNGQAVHGGFSGANVVLYSVNLGSGPRYLRVSQMSFDEAWRLLGFSGGGNSNGGNNGNYDDSIWEETTTTYTYGVMIDDLSVRVQATVEINTEAVDDLLYKHYEGTITYEEMVASLNSMGYTVI